MTWAPCLAASCAACSCFWIIDSLSPVQVACSSAPRTIRGIRGLLECSPGSNGPQDTRGEPRGEGRMPSVLLDEDLGELPAAAVPVKREQEDVVVGLVAARSVVGA